MKNFSRRSFLGASGALVAGGAAVGALARIGTPLPMDMPAAAPQRVAFTGPPVGQVWQDTSSSTIKVYDGAAWRTVGTVDKVR